MAAFRKLLYAPRFDTQSPQTDKESAYNGENKTQEATPLLFLDVTSPEITPCFSRKAKTNHLLRLYANMRSTVNLRPSKGGKSRCAKRVTYEDVRLQPHKAWPTLAPDYNRLPSKGASSDTYGFPPRNEANEISRSRTKQDVLRTIKRMVEENRVIRERLLTLRQQSRSK